MATAATTARIEPTQAELLAAWERMRQPTWPATFEEAMADALRSRLVRMAALHPAMAPPPGMTRAWPLPNCDENLRAAQTLFPPRRHHRAPVPPGIDRKRAASGERDDD